MWNDRISERRSAAEPVRREKFSCSKIYVATRKTCASDWSSWEGIFDSKNVQTQVAKLEEKSALPTFWEEPAEAQATLKNINELREKIAPYLALDLRLTDSETMLELLAEEETPEEPSLLEQQTELKLILKETDQLELETLLSGEHDRSDAIVEIKAGAGGTDACDWVTMLQKMYLKWAETRGYKCDVLEETEADIAGLKNTTFIIHGKNAFGYMRAERGVHRLVRMSPFDAAKRRQTSFASVDIMPDLGEEITVEINPDDLRIDYYRSGGAGGQHVNKTDSAVRITHLPTNTVVTCQNERSQHKNKATAMQVLQSRLLALEERENLERLAALRGEGKANEWGNQDRSYTFQPYTLIKDHRTGYETGDVIGVMNGDIDPFLQAYLKWMQSRDR